MPPARHANARWAAREVFHMAVTTESRVDPRTEPRTEKGISLSRGPALVIGTILLAAGLYMIYKQHFFPKLSNFPNGTAKVDGKVLFGLFGANGWTGMLTAICGGLLLFGAAQHLLAKTMSLIVGVVLGAAAIIGLANSGNVLGLPAANHLTELAWGIAAVILLFNALIPRRTRTVEPVYESGAGRRGVGTGRGHAGEAAVAGAGAGALAEHEHDRHREREAVGDEPGTAGGRGAGRRHAGEAAVAGAGAGALAEHEHDRHRERAAESETAGEPGSPGAPTAVGNTTGNPGAGRDANDPAAERGANDPATERGAAGAGQAAPGTSGSGGGQVGLAERARRWLRPGSEN